MIVKLLDGTRYDLADYDCAVESYLPPSMQMQHNTASIVGASAPLITDTSYNGRTIPVNFVYKAADIVDFDLLRDEIYALFTRKEAFFIAFKDKPYKQWLVKVESQFQIVPEVDIIGTFSINFICIKGWAESVGSSLDLQNRKEWDVDLWGYGMGVDWDKEYFYQHMTNQFTIDNIGNVPVDPCEHELEITIKGIFANYVKITNRTTGEVYQYNRSLAATDELKIKRVQTFRNGVSDFKNTNKRLLTLAPGDNLFVVEGGTLASITFDFKFPYK